MIIGTAGHIDHGKSALVTALTGRRMDRLAEERRRGITIELGFAPLDLGLGAPVGIVDVPGHEDFVRTMVAGASGMELVLLVVDAQEGIMPQTLEHLAVAEQLRIPAGIPVVTKADLATDEWLELVVADLTEHLAASPVRFGQPAIVSSVTGQGIAELRERLRILALTRPPSTAEDLLRLPVDRVFAAPGVGTVVTGTLWSGTVRVGDSVRLEPEGRAARVRSVECFGSPVDHVGPGARVALGLQGVAHGDLDRGHVVVAAVNEWTPTQAFDAVVHLLPGVARPLAARTRVRVDHGTREVMARVGPESPILPGTSGIARMTVEGELLLRGGDRFVLRSYSPVTTIGGGLVVDPAPPRRRAFPAGLRSDVPKERLEALVARRPGGLSEAMVPVLTGLSPREAQATIAASTRVVSIGRRLIDRAVLDHAVEVLAARVERQHRDEPSRPGVPLGTLRATLGAGAWLADAAIGVLTAQGRLTIADGVAARPGYQATSAGGEGEVDEVVALLASAGLEPPSVHELQQTGRFRDVEGALRVASGRGLAQRVDAARWYHSQALLQFVETLTELGRGGGEGITPGALRERLGLSRKFLIPLLEWSDSAGITARDPSGGRRLRTERQVP